MTHRLAVVDMGTNTLKYSVMEINDDGGFREINAQADTVRIGAGIAATGLIDAERAERAIESLVKYERLALGLGATAFIGVATSAMRRASNGSDLLDAIATKTGWQLRVISGTLEAELTWSGLQHLFPAKGAFLLADIGGGSTEVIAIQDGIVVSSESLNIGSGVLADEWFRQNPPGKAVADAKAAALAYLSTSAEIGRLDSPYVVLSGGNGLYLQKLAGWEAVNIAFSPATGTALMNRIAEIPAEMLAAYLGITRERASMLPAGAAIASAVMDAVQASNVAAVPSGVRTGIVRRWIQNQW